MLLDFCVDVEDDDQITVQGMEAAIKFLYGVPPCLSHDTVQPLLRIGSFFDIPALCGLASDFVFSNLAASNVVDS